MRERREKNKMEEMMEEKGVVEYGEQVRGRQKIHKKSNVDIRKTPRQKASTTPPTHNIQNKTKD